MLTRYSEDSNFDTVHTSSKQYEFQKILGLDEMGENKPVTRAKVSQFLKAFCFLSFSEE